jgi:hypothetical protein
LFGYQLIYIEGGELKRGKQTILTGMGFSEIPRN